MLGFLVGVFCVLFVACLWAGADAGNLSKEFPWQFRLAAYMRTPILVFFVIPLSFLRYITIKIRNQVRYQLRSIDESKRTHHQRVEQLTQQLALWNSSGKKSRIRTARPNWASMSTKLGSNKKGAFMVDTSCLNHILEVDLKAMTVTVEPGVTMGELTMQLLPAGFALLTQVEMESITVGGVTMGFGMETHSHVSGFFQESVCKYEIVTPDGKVLTVTPESDPELFYALPWSCGTIGFLTAVTLRLAKVKPYVHVKYIPTSSLDELAKKMQEFSTSDNPPYFLEATLYSRETAVIQCGEFVDKPTGSERQKINGINYWWKPFYFKWVKTFIDKKGGDEYIPLSHYYHRFSRSIFWELEEMIPFSNNPLFRLFWGWLGAPEVSLLKLFQGPVIRKASVCAHVVQESIMPVALLAEGVRKFEKWFDVYPLLVFPLRVYDRGEQSGFLRPQKKHLVPGKDWGIWCDLGAYGTPRAVKQGKMWDAKTTVRELEHWTREMGGWQAYYTDMFCTRREFRQMFDHALLDACRKRFGSEVAFPEVYDKVKSEEGLIDLSDVIAQEKGATKQ